MRMPPSVRAAVPLMVLALLLAACGGGTRLTKEELIAQGDAICKEASAKSDPLGSDLAEPSQESLSQWGDALGQLLPIYEDMVARLKDLSPPEADQGTWDEITGTLDQIVEGIKAAKDAADSGDLAAFNEALTAVVTPSGQAAQLAADYGFQECGSSGGGGSPAPAATP